MAALLALVLASFRMGFEFGRHGGGERRDRAAEARLTAFGRVAFDEYLASDMGDSRDVGDYLVVERDLGSRVEVEVSPRRHDDDHFGGRGRFGYDVKVTVDKASKRIVRQTIGS